MVPMLPGLWTTILLLLDLLSRSTSNTWGLGAIGTVTTDNGGGYGTFNHTHENHGVFRPHVLEQPIGADWELNPTFPISSYLADKLQRQRMTSASDTTYDSSARACVGVSTGTSSFAMHEGATGLVPAAISDSIPRAPSSSSQRQLDRPRWCTLFRETASRGG
jgi:hypothetical protein